MMYGLYRGMGLVRTPVAGHRVRSNHMQLRRFLLILMAMPAAAGICRGQDSTGFMLELGVEVGFAGGQFSSIPVFAGSTECGEFTGGPSRSSALGFRFIHPAFPAAGIDLSLGLLYGSFSGALMADALDPLLIFDAATRNPLEIGHQYRYNIEAQSILLELGSRYSPFGDLMLSGGFHLGYRSSGRLRQIDTIISGERIFQPEGGKGAGTRERTMLEGEPHSLNRFGLGMFAGASWRFPVGRRIWLCPGAFARFDLLSLVNERDWRGITAGASASLLFHFMPEPEPVPPPDTAAPPPPKLVASIDLYGTDDEERRLPAATIHIFETFRRMRTGRLDKVRFDRDAASIEGYFTGLARHETVTFEADSLDVSAPSELRRQVLNILGERLRHDSLASIELDGATARGEAPGLAHARALAVRRYLADVWGIDSARVEIRDGGRRPAQMDAAVVITTPTQGIVAPAVVERIEPAFDPPLIVLDPEFDAEAGVKSWRITLSHDGHEIGRYGSDDSASSDFRLDWTIVDENLGHERSMLMAELVVEDSLGRTVSSRSQTPLTIERSLRVVDRWEMGDGRREGLLFTLYQFPAGSAALRERNREVVEEIAESIRDGATIRVATSGGGELALRRSAAIADALRAALGRRGGGISIVKPEEMPIDDDSAPLLDLAGRGSTRVLVEQDLPDSGSP